YVFCGTVPRFAPAGCYPAPLVRGARTFLSGNLSVPPERPSDRLTRIGMGMPGLAVKSRGRSVRHKVKDSGCRAQHGASRPSSDRAAAPSAGEQLLEGAAHRRVGDAINPLRAEVALKRCHDLESRRVVLAADADAVAIFQQRFLQRD